MERMSRDIILSVVMHVGLIVATFFAAPFDFTRKDDFGDVIRVSMVSMPEIIAATPEPEPVAPPEIPAAIQTEPEEIPLDDPATSPEVAVDEPEEKPEPEPDTKPAEEKKPDKPKTKPNLDASTAPAGEVDRAGAATGETEVATPGGSLIAGTSVDNASFNYPFWFTLAHGKLAQNFRVPIVI
ncbi:MAG: hypothetical protein KKA42_06090, partial [candidate division Zixibacteria bacterium]|nr:hypothetical protein [candidate division Zixibacteria bacterium]